MIAASAPASASSRLPVQPATIANTSAMALFTAILREPSTCPPLSGRACRPRSQCLSSDANILIALQRSYGVAGVLLTQKRLDGEQK